MMPPSKTSIFHRLQTSSFTVAGDLQLPARIIGQVALPDLLTVEDVRSYRYLLDWI